ncbi:glycosyl transferase, family 2 [Cyanobium sp. PCC 7001]|uniref:glycosyltransferase n=1 Tax=Cyanobium sp. PCC 7001 TaxID=180281 RepID=UPI00018056AB|nr:glycosyltransferase family 2 protein [Cyanobium sp. PCC 7001]EDY38450.1 glycosyl transferase, family 2 [Cyanobium sp. PCC 7001]
MGWLGVSLVVRWLLGWGLALRLPELPAPAQAVEGRRVSVLIPARNEEATLPHLLTALAAQTITPLEVIVVDDHSSDGTAAIARQAALAAGEAQGPLPIRVLQPPPLPAGWCGKTWALHHGVLASRGAVLVFLDADTEPEPAFLERLLDRHRELGGLVSVQPYHRTERPYEQLSLLFNLVGLMAVPLGAGCGVAFGPALACSRADYDRAGGHAAVAGKVVEDWFLAHCFEAAGLPVSAFIGAGQIAYRMYPGGLGEMVIGFDKNFATAAGEVRWPWMLAVLLWLSGLFWAAWCLPAALLGWPLVGDRSLLVNGLVYAAFALQLLVLTHRVGRFRWINLLFPIPVLFFLGVFVLAILNLERGRVHWKGRVFSTRSP